MSPQQKEEELDSGVIVSPNGYILTNNHVVDHVTTMAAIMHDKHEYKARVVGTDLRTDIAVLKVDARSLGPITIGDSDELHVGDYVTNGHRQRDRPRQYGHRRLRKTSFSDPARHTKSGTSI